MNSLAGESGPRITGARAAWPGRSRRRLLSYGLAAIAVIAWGLVVWRTLRPPLWVPTPPLGTQDMVLCPAGTLPASLGRAEKSVDAFYIDRFEVTCEEYSRFLQETGLPFARLGWGSNKPPVGQEEHPVASVTLGEARQFASWRGKRLPTNDEWEWAARGELYQEWPWGSGVRTQVANTAEIGYGRTCPVGLFEEGRSPFGVYDMVGNVAELTEEPVRAGLSPRPRHFVRGGSFLDRLTDSGLTVLDTHVLEENEDGGSSFEVRRDRLWGSEGFGSDTGFRCAIDASVIDEEREVITLLRRLGGRDLWTWWFEVRPALAELERRGIASERRRQESAAELPAEDQWRVLGREGADVLAIIRYSAENAQDEALRERISSLVRRIEEAAGAGAG